jgi:uncharacterized protein
MLIVQPTGFCNINCSYCYLPDRQDKRRMEIGTFRKVLENVCSSGVFPNQFTINWHAGEPLTVPRAFYAAATEIIADVELRHGLDVRQSLQTNATLIDDDWCRLFIEAGIYLGVSIDGPKSLHDESRKARSGAGTFDAAMRGVRLLKAHSINFSAICVLTKSHLCDPERIYEFFVSEGFTSVSFNFDEIEGPNRTSSMMVEGVSETFKTFVHKFLALNERDGHPLRLPNLMVNLLAERTHIRNHQVEPWKLITVSIEGDVSTFSPELLGQDSVAHENFLLGNLCRETIEEISSRQPFLNLQDEIGSGVELCRQSCEYFRFCGGGSPANKFFENGTFRSTETLYCRLMKQAVCEVNLERASRIVEAAHLGFDVVRAPLQGSGV